MTSADASPRAGGTEAGFLPGQLGKLEMFSPDGISVSILLRPIAGHHYWTARATMRARFVHQTAEPVEWR